MRPAAELLSRLQRELALRSVELMYERRPELTESYGPLGRVRCLDDSAFHLRFLVSAVVVAEPAIFRDYALWTCRLLERYRIPREHLVDSFRAIAAAVDELAPAASAEARVVLEAGEEAVAA